MNVLALTEVLICSFAGDPLFRYLSADAPVSSEVTEKSYKIHSRRLTDTLRNGYLYKLETSSEGPHDGQFGGVLMIYKYPGKFSIRSYIGNMIAGCVDYWDSPKMSDMEQARLEAFLVVHDKYLDIALKQCNGKMTYLEVIAVMPFLQGKGLGKVLMDKVLELAGDEPIFLECTDTKNIQFYTKFGFKIMNQETLDDNETVITFMLRQ